MLQNCKQITIIQQLKANEVVSSVTGRQELIKCERKFLRRVYYSHLGVFRGHLQDESIRMLTQIRVEQ